MRTVKGFLVGAVCPIIIGVAAAVALAPSTASAFSSCENNICSTGTGDCIVTDEATSCTETTNLAGCRTSYCIID